MMMIKKGILIVAIFFFWMGVSFAQSQNLNYEEFLKLYFGITTHEMPIPEKKPLLLYTNLKPSNPLYQLLQSAVANGKFANIEVDLPLKRPALESDLALLLKVNYGQEMQATTGKQLSFDTLKTELQKLILRQQSEKAQTKQQVSKELQQAVAQEIFTLLKTKFIEKEKLENLQAPKYEGLSDFISKLGEKYTRYYTPSEGKTFMEMLQNEFAGVGMYLIQTGNQHPIVVKVIDKTPADKAWIKAWDTLIAVNGKSFSQYSDLEAFIQDLKGEAGTTVSVDIKRENQTLNFVVIREKIQIPLIHSKKQGTACYFQIHAFDIGIKKKLDQEMKNYWSCASRIFDLRDNPWGVVDEVVNILDEFIPKGKPILTISSQGGKEVLASKQDPIITMDKPLAILINEQTASASEIFAGVLKHYFPDKVTLIGVKSYGKGSVQEVVEFQEWSLLKYTVALWHIADQGVSLNHKGLSPDLMLSDDPQTIQDEVLVQLGLE